MTGVRGKCQAIVKSNHIVEPLGNLHGPAEFNSRCRFRIFERQSAIEHAHCVPLFADANEHDSETSKMDGIAAQRIRLRERSICGGGEDASVDLQSGFFIDGRGGINQTATDLCPFQCGGRQALEQLQSAG